MALTPTPVEVTYFYAEEYSPVCLDSYWEKISGPNDLIEWDTAWALTGGAYKAEIRFIVPLAKPSSILIVGVTVGGYSLTDIFTGLYPGSKVEAFDSSGNLVATAYSDIVERVLLVPNYGLSTDLAKLVFTTTATPAEQYGFGFLSVEVTCPIKVRVKLDSPLDASEIQAVLGLPPGAFVELPSFPIGDIAVFGRQLLPEVAVALPSPIGPVKIFLVAGVVFEIALPSPIGPIRLFIDVRGDAWSELWPVECGFAPPVARLSGYGYSRNAGLHRADMISGKTRQRRRWTDGSRTAAISVEVPTAALYAFEDFIKTLGYDWFNMPLVTEDSASAVAELHTVRIIGNPSFGEVSGESIIASLEIELQDRP